MEEFFPKDLPPLLIEHIEDRDLWRFKIDGSREVHLGLMSRPMSMAHWHALMCGGSKSRGELWRDGTAIKSHQDRCIADAIRDGVHDLVIGQVTVPALTCSYQWASEAGNAMAVDHPFAACYGRSANGEWVFSLRSNDEGMDVSAIAQQYGGGGHRHAAGFRIRSLDNL